MVLPRTPCQQEPGQLAGAQGGSTTWLGTLQELYIGFIPEALFILYKKQVVFFFFSQILISGDNTGSSGSLGEAIEAV